MSIPDPVYANPERSKNTWSHNSDRVPDNIFVVRIWRTVKHETVREVTSEIREYFDFYNNGRPHQFLDYHTPAEVYFDGFFKKKAVL